MTTRPDARYDRWRTIAMIVWAVVGILVLTAAALWGIGRIAPALVPFVMAFVIVFLLNGPVQVLEKRGMKRSVATLLCLVVALAVIGGVLALLGPAVGKQVTALVNAAPEYLNQVQQAETALEGRFFALPLPAWLTAAIKDASLQLGRFVVTFGDELARIALAVGGRIVTAVLDVFLSLIIAFWVLADLPKIRDELVVLVGPLHEADVEHLFKTVTRVVGGYLRGQSIASFVTAVIATIGLSIFHVPYALVLGLIAFFLNFVPYVGPVLTALIAGLLGMFVSPWTAVFAVVVIILAQNVTDFVVTPRVMSSQVDLHPTLVIFSLLVGGTLFGIPGLLFAIPVAATGKGLFVYYYERQTDRRLGSTDGALFRRSAGSSSAAGIAAEGDEPAESQSGDDAD